MVSPPELGVEAITINGAWADNAQRHVQWLRHLAEAARPERLSSLERARLTQLLGPRMDEGASGGLARWMELLRGRARTSAGRVVHGDDEVDAVVVDAVQLIAEAAWAAATRAPWRCAAEVVPTLP